MTDALQASSSLPLPAYQTIQGSHDPLPPSSPQALSKALDTRSADNKADAVDDFKSYLDQSSVTLLAKTETKPEVDTAALISQSSVYSTPDGLRPI